MDIIDWFIIMPTNTFQFETCDVQFWRNDSKGAQQQGRATAAHATWQNDNRRLVTRFLIILSVRILEWTTVVIQNRRISLQDPNVSSGQYSVSQARGNEHLSDVRQEIQRTFYTVVTKPQRWVTVVRIITSNWVQYRKFDFLPGIWIVWISNNLKLCKLYTNFSISALITSWDHKNLTFLSYLSKIPIHSAIPLKTLKTRACWSVKFASRASAAVIHPSTASPAFF